MTFEIAIMYLKPDKEKGENNLLGFYIASAM